MISKTLETYGRLDYAFNNAGVSPVKIGARITTQTEEDFDRVIRVNLKGVFLCMKYELPEMKKQGGGSIVNCSSVAGLRGNIADTSAYIASKHGVTGLTKSAAIEYAKAGIRVNAICPGYTLTPMLIDAINANPLVGTRMSERVPMGRGGTPEEMAEAALWLCSDTSSYITGVNLVVDGGFIS